MVEGLLRPFCRSWGTCRHARLEWCVVHALLRQRKHSRCLSRAALCNALPSIALVKRAVSGREDTPYVLPAASLRGNMILTEEEARARWCPYSRSVGMIRDGGNINRITSGYNRHDGGDIPACIASSCMVWRFAEAKVIRDIDLVTSDVEPEKPRLGYCGAATKPEYD